MLECLAYSKKYINKEFMSKVALRVYQLYKCNNIRDRELPGMLAYLSEIEANLQTRSFYLE